MPSAARATTPTTTTTTAKGSGTQRSENAQLRTAMRAINESLLAPEPGAAPSAILMVSPGNTNPKRRECKHKRGGLNIL